MPSGELRLEHVTTNPFYAVSRMRILGVTCESEEEEESTSPGVCLRAITCSGGQLERGLRVVLRPILQGALHVRSVIQQQLWRRGVETRGGGREEGENKPGGRGGRRETGEGEMVCYTQRKSLNCWKPKAPHLDRPCCGHRYPPSLDSVWGSHWWCRLP